MLLDTGGITGIFAFFLFQMVFMDTAATIPTGAMAERFKFSGFVLMGFGDHGNLTPRRWLDMGRRLVAEPRSRRGFRPWRRGLRRIGRRTVVGGSVALAGAIVVGPRIGKFDSKDGRCSSPPHPLGILGTVVLFFG